ncbi:hypothetical protein LUZ62_039044 [Rhynchospora pubera]|uniref:F-box domain-containing protein n=1 Tax=Rhynchospora pubera TaxID=906938 RepID=A0AAV8F322_9POAL|nr:hypothetical protein LUZ62_039044 [Rhynchospora pubera]
MTTASTSSRHCRRRREDGTTVRNWSELPDGPLHTILTCLCSFVDFISFSSVCRSWRAVTSSLSPSEITSRFPPLLLIASYTREGRVSGCRVLDPASPSFSCSLDRICSASAKFPFLTSHGRFLRSVGPARQRQHVILNPFTGEEIQSPIMPKGYTSFNRFHYTHLSSIDSALLLFTNDTVFHWRIGSSSWSCHSPRIHPSGREIVAIVNGTVYAVDSGERLFVLDLSPELHLRQLAVGGIGVGSFSFQSFLVDCGGELLFLRLVPTERIIGMQLEAFRLDLSANQARWVKMETLGNWAIFVGYWPPLPGLAVENPERWGGRSNCVYFATNENVDWPWMVIKLGEEIDTSNPESPLFNGNPGQRVKTSWVYPGL